MRVKRYVAKTIQEAIAQVKFDLGREAIILHTKPIRQGGFMGLFTRKAIEVIAAVDPQAGEKMAAPAQNQPVPENKPVNPPVNTGVYKAPASGAAVPREAIQDLKEELAEVRTLVQEISLRVNNGLPDEKDLPIDLTIYKKIKDFCTRQEIPLSLLDDFINRAHEINHGGLREDLSAFLADQTSTGPVFTSLPKGQIITLIGPTGVGKTTTLAKLAASSTLFEKKKICLITIDTYRIAAVEQLKTYGEIIGLPVEVVYNPQEFARTLANNQDKDLIMVDTAGRSQNNKAHLEELQQFLAVAPSSRNFLVLSLVSRLEDLRTAYKQFSLIPLHGMIFTKLDETATFGSLLNLTKEANLPILYLTNGQNVPDDIEIATGERIASLLMESFPDA